MQAILKTYFFCFIRKFIIEHCFTRKIAVTFNVRMKMNIHSFYVVEIRLWQ